MEKTSTIFLTILIIENLLLATSLVIYLYRKCRKCSKIKEIDHIFNKLCGKCEKANGLPKSNGKDKNKDQIDIY